MELELGLQNSANDRGMINELEFDVSKQAPYIISRSSVLYYPSGGTVYAPRGSRTLRIPLTSESGFLDPSTVNLRFKFNNTGNRPIKLLNALPANFFYRMRILCHQTVVEDWAYYNRQYNVIHTMMNAERKLNDYSMGFGTNDDVDEGNFYKPLHFESGNIPPQIEPHSSRTVQFNLLSGLLSCGKYIPLSYLKGGLTIELELVGSVLDAITYVDADSARYDWTITEPNVCADIVQIDSQLEESFRSGIQQGRPMIITYDSFVCMLQSMPATNEATISLSRSFTRLKNLFITFYNPVKKLAKVGDNDFRLTEEVDTEIPLNQINHFVHPNFIHPGNSNLNRFPEVPNLNRDDIRHEGFMRYNPENDRLSTQIQVGSALFPHQPIESLSTSYYHLRKALNLVNPTMPLALNINDREYRSFKHIIGIGMEKAENVFASGLNTKASDLITIKLKNLVHKKVVGDSPGQDLAGSAPQYMYVQLHYSAMMIITEKGIEILE